MSASNKEIVESWFDQVWNRGDESAIDRLMASTARVHGLSASDDGAILGPDGFKPYFKAFRDAFPDIKVELQRMVSDKEFVACHCLVTGTHKGSGLRGLAATGSKIRFEGMAIARIQDGQIQEGWNCFDFLSLYQQIGVLPPLPA